MSEIKKALESVGVSGKVFDEVRGFVSANLALLASCQKPHDFSICLDRMTGQPIQNPTPEQQFCDYWRCSKCGGKVDSLHKIHYNQGLADAFKQASREQK